MGQKCVRGQFAVVTSVNSAPSGLCLLYFPIMTRNGRKGCRAVDYADVASLCAYVYYYKALFHLLWNRVLVVNILLQARLYPKRRSTLYIYNTIFDYNIVVIMGKAITLLKKYCPSGYFCLLENEAFLYDLIHKELSASCLVINRESLESRSDGTWYWKSDSNQLG